MADAMALRLREQSVRAGDRVAIWMESSPEAVAAIFAVLKAGAAFVPLHPQTKPPKVAMILRDCQARTIVAPGEWVTAEIRAACAESPSVHTDLAAILYTSGSTGVPRGVMLGHRNIVAASASIIEYLGNREDDVVLDFLPLSFDYGLYNVLMPLRFGGTVVLDRGFIAPHQILAGDRFRMDDEGFLYFVARMDDMIKTSGQLVSPKEIESTVLALEGVEEAVAYGRPDEILGQSIHLVVRTAADAALTSADVVAWCTARLEKWMVPRSVDVRRELPRTTTGKTARREITAPLIGG